jgi:hypothetical protein
MTKTREEWLVAATNLLRSDFENVYTPIPEKVRVTCGWPSKSGRAKKKRVIGEAWPAKCSEDGYAEVFIAPTVTGMIALETLVHELLHTATPDEGHRGKFRTAAIGLGLEGKMTATHAGPALVVCLQAIITELGEYPHAVLTPTEKKVQSTRMLKVVCPDCQWAARTSKKWIDLGLPTCACGAKMEEV